MNTSKDQRERVGRIIRLHANSREDIDELNAGDIAAIIGLKTSFTGDTLCDPEHPIVCPDKKIPNNKTKLFIYTENYTALKKASPVFKMDTSETFIFL